VRISRRKCNSVSNLCSTSGHCNQAQAVPKMDASTSGATPSIQYHNIIDQSLTLVTPLQQSLQRLQRHCFGDAHPGEFPLATNPSVVLHVLTACDLEPQDLASLEASSTKFSNFALLELIMPLIGFAAHVRQHAHSSGNLPTLPRTLNYPLLSSPHRTCARKEPSLSR